MPIVEYRLVAGRHDDADIDILLRRSCALLAEVLDTPIDRTRAFAHEVRPGLASVGGEAVRRGVDEAPFFSFFLLDGRPLEQRQVLLAGFTDLLVECLGADRERVRGCVIIVSPDDWAIAGVPASQARRAEVGARARAAAPEQPFNP
jgi:phenylpyruvate tautomerase PptA (4-oxalocrotonate tautomerase family)